MNDENQGNLEKVPEKGIQVCGLDAVHQRRLFGTAVAVDCAASHHGSAFRSAYRERWNRFLKKIE